MKMQGAIFLDITIQLIDFRVFIGSSDGLPDTTFIESNH